MIKELCRPGSMVVLLCGIMLAVLQSGASGPQLPGREFVPAPSDSQVALAAGTEITDLSNWDYTADRFLFRFKFTQKGP
jgi:hypothetical protein